jgi:hypothetical protein
MGRTAHIIFGGQPLGVILWVNGHSPVVHKNHYPFSALVRQWRYNVERQSVKSVILNSVGYDEGTKTLEIEFQTGLVYRYSGVPPKVYNDLMFSSEMGKYFSEKIRPRFHTKQVVA